MLINPCAGINNQEVVGNLHLGWSLILSDSITGNINFFESLILAQDERWRRALSMQVEWSQDNGRRVSNI
jgi:hypothetical protein